MNSNFNDMVFAFVTPRGRTPLLIKVIKALQKLKNCKEECLWDVDLHLEHDVEGIIVDEHGVWQLCDGGYSSGVTEATEDDTVFVPYDIIVKTLQEGGLLE